ncbi:MAG TPA: alpha-amylase family glycosyl hydrolase [Ignavibacteriales bacterium]|nr:alpha-amylase family glycosyl hydrolase [Ignavibacteriales bacterium]
MKVLGKVLFIYLVLSLYLFANEFIKVEPSNWWVGFKDNNLQIMIYAPNIASYKVKLKNTAAKLEKVNYVDSKNYIFIDLNLSNAQPGKFIICLYNDKEEKNIEYELKLRAYKPLGQITQSDVIYLLMPDRFANGDKTNDTLSKFFEKSDRNNVDSRHGGDLKGIIDNLNYFVDMGFTTLWLTPIQENNQKKYSYHGYAITDFYKVDERFGTNKDYKELVEEAHKKNIKVIMDMVYNHCGLYHWWMKDLPTYDWVYHPYKLAEKLTSLNIFDIVDENNLYTEKFIRTNYNPSTVSDPYASNYDKLKFNTGWFDVAMADLNQNNKFLAKYLIQMTIWWIESNNIDGLRIDTYPYPDKLFMNSLVNRIYSEYPNFYIVGEAWTEDVPKEAFWTKNKINNQYFSSSLKSVISFKFMNAVNDAFKPNGNIYELYKLLSQDFLYENPKNHMIFLDNHDIQRIFRVYNNDKDALKLALTFLFTTRGIPQFYYGTEVLMHNDMNVSHGLGREDFPGGWENDSVNVFKYKNLSADIKEIKYFIKNLLKWRKENKELFENSKLIHFIPQNQMYVYFKVAKNKTVMIILNNNAKENKFDKNIYNEILHNKTEAIEPMSGKKYDLNNLIIEPKTALVLEVE